MMKVQFYQACKIGDPETLRHFFSPAVPFHQLILEQVNQINISGEYPLITAVKSGNVEVVEILCDHGANVDVGLKEEDTPLLEACKRGYKEIVALLLEKGATMELGNCGVVPLFKAAMSKLEVLELLLKKGANVDALNPNKQTLLHYACDRGPIELSLLLLRYGANPNVKDLKHLNPFLYTCLRPTEEVELVEALISYGGYINPQAGLFTFTSPLQLACLEGKLKVIEVLLRHGADITLIKTELRNLRTDVLEKLHDCGCSIPLLAIAASVKDYKSMENYIKSGKVSLDLLDASGISALQYSIHEGNLQMAQLLVLSGADVNTRKSHQNMSALHELVMLAFRNNIKDIEPLLQVSELLIAHGADINAKHIRILNKYRNYGTLGTKLLTIEIIQTPLHVAMRKKLQCFITYLVEKGAKYMHKEITNLTYNNSKTNLVSIWQMCDKHNLDKMIFGGKWTPDNHNRHPECVRKAIVSMLLINNRQKWKLDNFSLYRIFDMLAYSWQK